jgi:1,4-alpha-glucan branching enzyme
VSATGAFTFVLHSHLPYARLAGRWPHGEEWIHEAASETYIPLLQTLYDLREEGVPYRLTIGITPILAEQLADPDVLDHFDEYLDEKIRAAKADIAYFEAEAEIGVIHDTDPLADDPAENRPATATPAEQLRTSDPHLRFLAQWYKDWFEQIKHAFDSRFNRDIIGAFRRLQQEGYIEITTSAATHGYLPLLSRDSSIRGQLRTGVRSYQRLFGTRPTGIWLPECAYRPAYLTEDGIVRPGIEHFLSENDLKVFFSETHAITGGQPVGVAAGDVIGPYGAIKRRYVIPAARTAPHSQATTYRPYYVADTAAGVGAEQHSGVAVIGRNNDSGMQVWSAATGYPGDVDYREFHKKAGTSGLQYWRVTGSRVELGDKDLYHPDWAAYKVEQHAEHFAHLVGDLLRNYHEKTGDFGLVASNYDTELFGHWWFEGVDWLGRVLRHLASNPEIELTTATRFITEHPPRQVLNLPEGSWGTGGTHFTWDNPETHWMWEPIHEAENRMEALVAHYPSPHNAEQAVLNQAARELLLLQSSDWPFLVTTGQAREYAIQRFSQHLERFENLAASLEKGAPDSELAAEYWELDKVFPDIDYRWFRQ